MQASEQVIITDVLVIGAGIAGCFAAIKAKELDADVLMVADKEFTINEIMQFMELADRLHVAIKILSDKMTVLQLEAKMPADHIHGVPLVHFDDPRKPEIRRIVSGLMSKIAALILVVLSSPVMIVAAILIKLTSKGPIMFIQERLVNAFYFRLYEDSK